MRPFTLLATATFLALASTPVYADIVEVTFTGTVTSLPFGGAGPVAGVSVGDPFTAVLTYNENQPDANPDPEIGFYFDYTFGLAVHTPSGDVIVPGSTIAPFVVNNDDVIASEDRVHNAASAGDTAHFDFSDSSMAGVSSDALSEVNWQVLLTQSGGGAQVKVRASNAAIVMAGGISSLGVTRTVDFPLDIRPRRCPNLLETNKGSFKGAILGAPAFDPQQVDIASLMLARKSSASAIFPMDCSYRDVATPDEPFVGKVDAFDCTDLGRDGLTDLVCTYDMGSFLDSIGPVGDGEAVILQVTGSLLDGTPIVGEDIGIVTMGKGNDGPGGNKPEKNCKDGKDNDGDSLIDCNDPDCASSRWCPSP